MNELKLKSVLAGMLAAQSLVIDIDDQVRVLRDIAQDLLDEQQRIAEEPKHDEENNDCPQNRCGEWAGCNNYECEGEHQCTCV
jgi:hypothetical protein